MDIGLVMAFVFMAAGLLILFGVLVPLPGQIARERGHPSADAINTLAWVSILLWPLWVVAYVWARSSPQIHRRPAGQ